MSAAAFPGVVAAAAAGLVLADNAAASQLPQSALDRAARFLALENAQRGAYGRQLYTSAIVTEARAAFAELLDVAPDNVGFGANATSIALAFARTFAHVVQAGDRVVVTAADHLANVVPWMWLRRFGAVVDVVPVTPNGDLDEAVYDALLEREPLVVALPWASNVTGTVFDLEALAERAAAAGAMVVVDGVQAAPHAPVTIPETVDFAFFSAYKLFAPHFGAWYARDEVIDRFFRVEDPLLPTAEIAWTMETGTQSFEALAGWLGTVDYLRALGGGNLRDALARIADGERALAAAGLSGFAARADRLRLLGRGPAEARLPIFAFNLHGRSPASVGAALAAAGIEARVGDFYAPQLLRALAHDHHATAVRLSFAHYNTPADLERCFAALDALR